MTTDNDKVTPLHTQDDDDRNAMAYLRRECEAHGWDLADFMEYGPPEDAYECVSCGTPPLYWFFGAFTQLDGRIIHKACGRSDTIHHRHDPAAVAAALSKLPK